MTAKAVLKAWNTRNGQTLRVYLKPEVWILGHPAPHTLATVSDDGTGLYLRGTGGICTVSNKDVDLIKPQVPSKI